MLDLIRRADRTTWCSRLRAAPGRQTLEVEPETILFQDEPTSFPSLEPGQEQRVHVAITSDDFPPGVPRVVLVRLRWRDDLGSQAKDMNLTV